jgi:hypothetical protein
MGSTSVSGDFNADGKADIALTGPAHWFTVPVAFSKGDGTFSVTNVPLPGPAAPSNPQVTDETLTTLKIAREINSSRHSVSS